jgi:hypothetical protein
MFRPFALVTVGDPVVLTAVEKVEMITTPLLP